VPIDQDEGSVARDEFYQVVVGKNPGQLKAYWSKVIFTGRGKPPAVVADGAAARKRVASDSHAIAYVERTLVDETVKVVKVDERSASGRWNLEGSAIQQLESHEVKVNGVRVVGEVDERPDFR